MKSLFPLIFIASLAIACGPTRLDDLAQPVVLWSQGNSLCSKELALDAKGSLWEDGGCETETNFKQVGTVARVPADALRLRFDALPAADLPLDGICPGGLRHTFSRHASDSVSTSACGTSRKYDDMSGLPESFRALAEAFKML